MDPDKVIAWMMCSNDRMPVNHKVSVGWQIAATFIIIANFWAFYRIRKLRKYLAYVYVPSIAVSVAISAYYFSTLNLVEQGGDTMMPGEPTYQPYDFQLLNPYLLWSSIASSVGFQALAVYLVVRWSRDHNQKYEARPNAN